MNTTIFVNDLLENSVYMIGITVFNTVGNISTSRKEICEWLASFFLANSTKFYTDTTDVQNVTAVPLNNTNNFMLQCLFVTGSNARGCMVVLVSEFRNVTENLTREDSNNTISGALNVTGILTNFCEVFGFDIESDGSIGTLAIPGIIKSDVLSCSNDNTGTTSHSKSNCCRLHS